MLKSSPGPCPICGAAHTACTSDSGPITVQQLPSRDVAARAVPVDGKPGVFVADASTSIFAPAAGVGAVPPLGDGTDGQSFSTATYRGTNKKRGPAAAK